MDYIGRASFTNSIAFHLVSHEGWQYAIKEVDLTLSLGPVKTHIPTGTTYVAIGTPQEQVERAMDIIACVMETSASCK